MSAELPEGQSREELLAEVAGLKEQIKSLTSDEDTKPERKPSEYDAKGHLIVRLPGNKVVTLRELNGHESLVADGYMGETVNPMAIMKIYALMAIQTVSFGLAPQMIPSATKNVTGCFARARLFSSRELLLLMEQYTAEYMSQPLDEESLKNSATPQQD